ncbi:equilibrative nucleoside transporter 3-like [Diaphorina citri]|uniref:Equilibrative nucleoside transporter 3-like n=1 Tax=Diaphorina citri TaxID=121845 RepID=A0A1S3DFZ0_DIACI|nr:equilibrative nucleoside transporter 3-like [Diaphorina citri]
MSYSVNTRPLLEDSTSEFDNDDANDSTVEVRDVKPLFKMSVPDDRFNVAYIIFYLLGTVVLLPWFFFINANKYWMYKLRDINSTSNSSQNSDLFNSSPDDAYFNDDDGKRSKLQADFLSYLSVASTVPSLIFLIVNTYLANRISIGIRLVSSLVVMLLLFVTTTVMVKVNSDQWQELFFIITLSIVVLLNIASSIMQGALFGLVGQFPSKYIGASVSGQALGGVLAAVSCIISLIVAATPTRSAFVYFIMADVALLASLGAYFYLRTTVSILFKRSTIDNLAYLEKEVAQGLSKKEYTIALLLDGLKAFDMTWRFKIIKTLKEFGIDGYMLQYLTMQYADMFASSCRATLPNNRQQNSIHEIKSYRQKNYQAQKTTELDELCWIYRSPRNNGWWVLLFSISRFVFMPLVLLCNIQPRTHLPVLITSDLVYATIVLLMGLSNGYLANITFICAAK